MECAYIRIVRIPRHVAGAVAREHLQEPPARELCRVLVADADEAVAVQRREPGPLTDRNVECRDVRVADERLRIGGDHVEVDVRDRLRRPEAALE